MKKLLTVLAVALAICTMVSMLCISALAEDPTVKYSGKDGDVNVEILSDGTMKLSGTGKTSDTHIDWETTATVTVTKVIIGEGVSYIGKDFFKGLAGLTTVEFATRTGSLELGEGAFAGTTALTAITLPTTTTAIGKDCFKGSALTSFTAPAGLKTIGASAFEGSAVATLTLHGNIESIGNGAFKGLALTSDITIYAGVAYGTGVYENVTVGAPAKVIIEWGVTTIPSKMFAGSTISKIHWVNETEGGIPSSVTSIANDAFLGCASLTEVYVNSANTKYMSGEFGYYLYELDAATKTAVLRYVFGPTSGSTIVVPETIIDSRNVIYTVVGIDADAFKHVIGSATAIDIQAKLTELPEGLLVGVNVASVKLPAQLTKIPASLCEGNTALTTIELPASCTEIGEKAFKGCTSLATIAIPETVASIGASAFEGSGLTAVVVPASVKTIADSAFKDCTALTSVTVKGAEEIGANAFKGCTALQTVVLEGTKSIGASAFEGCGTSAIMTVTLPEGLESIGDKAFYDCDYLMAIELPSTLTTIGAEAFADCLRLADRAGNYPLVIPDSVTAIGAGAFANSGIYSVTIGKGLTALSNNLFKGCIKLTAVTFGENVETIGESAFEGCSVLNNVVLDAAVKSIGKNAFKDCVALAVIKLDAALESIGEGAFLGDSALAEIELNAGLKTIGASAFKGTGLTAIAFPKSVTSIGDSAFEGCALATISFEKGSALAEVGKAAFAELSSATLKIDNMPIIATIGDKAFGFTNAAPAASTIGSIKITFVGTSAEWFDLLLKLYTQEMKAGTYATTNSHDNLAAVTRGPVAAPVAVADTLVICLGDHDACKLYEVTCTACGGAGCANCVDGKVVVSCNHGKTASGCASCLYGAGLKIGDTCTACGATAYSAFIPGANREGDCYVTYLVYTCERCGMTVKGSFLYNEQHNSKVVYDGKGENGRDKTHTECADCGKKLSDSVEMAATCVEQVVTWTSNNDGDCLTNYGTMSGVCPTCGETQTRAATASDPGVTVHNIPNWTVIQEPTCTAPGYKAGICQTCGQGIDAVIPATGHNMSDYVSDGNALCVPGYCMMTSTCLNGCGLTNTVTDDVTVNPDNHVFMNHKCYFCGAVEVPKPAETVIVTVPGETVVVTVPGETVVVTVPGPIVTVPVTTAGSGNSGDAVETGDYLAIAIAAAVMAIGTAVIVKKVK